MRITGREWSRFPQKSDNKNDQQGFPGGPMVKNLPATAGDPGLICGLGSSHMPQSNMHHAPQLLKPKCPSACAPQEKPPQWGACAPRLESRPCSPHLEESPHAATKTQHSQNLKNDQQLIVTQFRTNTWALSVER